MKVEYSKKWGLHLKTKGATNTGQKELQIFPGVKCRFLLGVGHGKPCY